MTCPGLRSQDGTLCLCAVGNRQPDRAPVPVAAILAHASALVNSPRIHTRGVVGSFWIGVFADSCEPRNLHRVASVVDYREVKPQETLNTHSPLVQGLRLHHFPELFPLVFCRIMVDTDHAKEDIGAFHILLTVLKDSVQCTMKSSGNSFSSKNTRLSF